MSLVYCKSQKFLEDVDGNVIDEKTGSEPYYFQNQFKFPIPVNKGSKIELVSADLRISPLYEISAALKNDSITFGIGTKAAGNFQKVVKIPSGTYSDTRLANIIENAMNEVQILDMAKWSMDFQNEADQDVENRNKFRLFLKNTPNDFTINSSTDENEYKLLESKMGYKETDVQRDTGIGTIDEEVLIFNNPTNSKIYTKEYSFGSATNDTTKSSLLISNSVVPSKHGIFQAGGNCNLIVRPVQTYIFDHATFKDTNSLLNLNNAGSFVREYQVKPYTGANGYDLQFEEQGGGSAKLYGKFITTQAAMDGYTMPNSANSKNIPFGNFLVLNGYDGAVQSTLSFNEYVVQVEKVSKELITGWKVWGGMNSATTYELVGKTAADKTRIRTGLTTASIGCYGAFGLGVSRGECVLSGTNQTNTGTDGRFTRASIYNTDALSVESEVGISIDCDYVVQYTPNSNGKDGFLSTNYGIQTTGKVAGENGWITMGKQVEDAVIDIKVILPTLNFGVDNLLITAKVFNYNCITYYVNHDTGGNLVFDPANSVVLGSSFSDEKDVGVSLPMNICEASAPFMPVIYTSNSYVINTGLSNDGGDYLINGDYSILGVDKSLAYLYEYMNTNWSNAYTIPPRQPKLTIGEICVNLNMVDKVQTYIANGFSGLGGEKSIPITKGQVDKNSGVISLFPVAIRLGEFSENSVEATQLVDNGFEYQPTRFTTLYFNLGFDRLLMTDAGNPEVSEWFSENKPEHNDSSNYVVNLNNLGRVQGYNSSTSNVSQMVAIIPDAELFQQESNNDYHFAASYPLPVELNLVDDQKINNFNVSITRDNGKPARNLTHPTSLLFRITK
mgnify:CR=1 FL=1